MRLGEDKVSVSEGRLVVEKIDSLIFVLTVLLKEIGMNESNVIYTVFWASMPRFKELPDATSPSLLMAAGLPSSMVAILLKSSLFHPKYPLNADCDLLFPGT